MKGLMLSFIVAFLPLIGGAQPVQFTSDSIPIADGKVAFNVSFKFNLSKNEFHKRAYSYLNDVLNPSAGKFSTDNDDSTICHITDYVSIENGRLQKFGMYMTYDIQLAYNKKGTCNMVINNISYMEKRYFETNETKKNSQRKLVMPEWSGKDIMIDKKYRLLFIKKVSEKITDTSLERINEIIGGLYSAFVKK